MGPPQGLRFVPASRIRGYGHMRPAHNGRRTGADTAMGKAVFIAAIF